MPQHTNVKQLRQPTQFFSNLICQAKEVELLKTLGCQLKQQHLSNLFNFIHNHDKTPHFAYLLESNGLKATGIWKMVTGKKWSISNCIKEDKNWTDNWDKILQQFKNEKNIEEEQKKSLETQNYLKLYSLFQMP